MTSWRPYWCSKTMTRGHVGIPNHLFVPKHFLFLNICKDAGHVNENALH